MVYLEHGLTVNRCVRHVVEVLLPRAILEMLLFWRRFDTDSSIEKIPATVALEVPLLRCGITVAWV